MTRTIGAVTCCTALVVTACNASDRERGEAERVMRIPASEASRTELGVETWTLSLSSSGDRHARIVLRAEAVNGRELASISRESMVDRERATVSFVVGGDSGSSAFSLTSENSGPFSWVGEPAQSASTIDVQRLFTAAERDLEGLTKGASNVSTKDTSASAPELVEERVSLGTCAVLLSECEAALVSEAKSALSNVTSCGEARRLSAEQAECSGPHRGPVVGAMCEQIGRSLSYAKERCEAASRDAVARAREIARLTNASCRLHTNLPECKR